MFRAMFSLIIKSILTVITASGFIHVCRCRLLSWLSRNCKWYDIIWHIISHHITSRHVTSYIISYLWYVVIYTIRYDVMCCDVIWWYMIRYDMIYDMIRCLFPFFYTEEKCGPSGKTIKKTPLTLIEMKCFRRTARSTFWLQKEWRKYERVKSRARLVNVKENLQISIRY